LRAFRLNSLTIQRFPPGVITEAEAHQMAAAHEVAKVIEVDDFAPEALSPIYRKPAEVHQFFQQLGETRAAS
jgi:acyl-CoA dehydrogenase